jgi:NADH-ubiquinone oxidoreductase chain 5
MYLLVLYFPFLTFLIIGLFGRYLGVNGSKILAIINMCFVSLVSYFIFYEVVLKGVICSFKIFSWFNIGLFNIN